MLFASARQQVSFMKISEPLRPWAVESSEYLFREPWLTVRKERVRLANGHVIPGYYVMEYPAWINVIARTTDGRFVFVRQYRHALGRTDYELPAGVAESEDASPLESARRELLEETGYGNGHWQEWMIVCQNPATHTNLTYTYLATGVEQIARPKLDDGEELSVHLFTAEEVSGMLHRGEIIQALHAAPLWKYLAVNGL
jgi:ADP-ribose pyrophosphatase